MNTIFIEIGMFCVALLSAVYVQIWGYRKRYRDCRLFGRLLMATIAIMVVDTMGWVIDGHPLWGQVWLTTLIDGLDLIITSIVCWCWVRYASYIARGSEKEKIKWYKDFATWLLLLQLVLVISSQFFGFYYSVDTMGVYHREKGYWMHSMISLSMLTYSSISCLKSYFGEKDEEWKRELLFVAFIILIPIVGNIFQFLVYGYPTVWLCMVFMIFTVYIHIQNKRMNAEREKQNKKLEKALLQAQIANNAKTDFLSHMSHDMRTPMNDGILGITALLRDRTDPEEIKADIEQIENSGKYLLRLINDTLDMSKIESGKLELHPSVTDRKEILSNVNTIAKVLTSQKGVHLITEFKVKKPELSIPVIADESRIEQILINIISNAVKFTPKGGSVTIFMENISVKEEMVSDRYVITDTGIGMSADFQSHLFEPFAQEGRLNTDYESGTGLGLSIVKQIVDLMGGTILVESRWNQGTKITLELTYPRAGEDEKHLSETEVDLSALNGKHILLCEDHPINAKIAIRLLEKQHVIVEWAKNGQMGVDMLKASPEYYYAAVLMDIRMPVLNGIEATKVIRQINDRKDAKEIPIIAVTANAFDEDVRLCEEAGMNAHLSKPIDTKLLFEVLVQEICSE